MDMTPFPNEAQIFFNELTERVLYITVMMEHNLFTICNFWPFVCFLYFQYLLRVTYEMTICFLGSSSEYTQLLSHQISSMTFFDAQFNIRCGLSWFITLRSPSFSFDLIADNLFLTTSDYTFRRKAYFYAFEMHIANRDSLCDVNFFQFMWGIQTSSFLTSLKHFKWYFFLFLPVIHLKFIESIAWLNYNQFQLYLSFDHQKCQWIDENVGQLWVENI